MLNKFCKKPLYEVTRTLARVAMGAQKAELVIRNARLVNVCTAEIQEGIDVAIAEGRIALVGDAAHCIGPETTVIDANGQYIAPGFMDGHIHVESSMISVGEYAKAVVPCGTTGIFMDPHEICNVCGKEGVRIMIEDAKRSPLKAMSNAPSCVPAVAGFEDTGAAIRADDIRENDGLGRHHGTRRDDELPQRDRRRRKTSMPSWPRRSNPTISSPAISPFPIPAPR